MARTRVFGVKAETKASTSSFALFGSVGVETRTIESPKRLALTSQATLFVGWFCSQRTISSPESRSRPLLMVLLASLVFRTSAISSGLTPSCPATFARELSRRSTNLARLLNEQSRSMEEVSSLPRSATARGDGHKFAAFIGTFSSVKENWARTRRQE